MNMQSYDSIINDIKLVIWDLDNTIWKGTLAENDDIELYPNIKFIIETFNKRGIINSICSKNFYDKAKIKLSEYGLWEQFVYPSIDFLPKGQKIAALISEIHLRPCNVLFIDDSIHELNEVRNYVSDINLLHANYVSSLLTNEYLRGKDDSSLSRLNYYKQLEKIRDVQNTFTDNVEFLKSIHIRVQFIDYTADLFERIYEMIERTNQLNFTKKKITVELKNELENSNTECACIRVITDLGDMGIVGFYSVRDDELLHFLFSCRVMNMGIEQWVYQQLNCPRLEIIGETASVVSPDTPAVEYISIYKEEVTINECDHIRKYIDKSNQTNIFALGACDMYFTVGNLMQLNNDVTFETNFFKGDSRCVNIGSEYIRSCFEMNQIEKDYCIKHFQNYKGNTVFKTEIFNKMYDFVVLSFLDDFVYYIYEKKENKNIRILRLFDPVVDEYIENMTQDDQMKWLADNFNPAHYISEERFYENLSWIQNKLNPNTSMILINGPEYDYFMDSDPHNDVIRDNIIRLNKIIVKFVSDNPKNTRMVDVNKYITKRSDFTDNIFHWKSHPCYYIARDCLKYMAEKKLRSNNNVLGLLPIQNRKIVLYGHDEYTSLVYYSLIANGIDISVVCSTEKSTLGDIQIQHYDLLKDNYNTYYVIITESKDFIETKNILIDYGYEEHYDFISYVSDAL
ncbi:MAG: hypothetical protein K0R00_241 [Herbinix sp.]|jgi:FkbH-like protein|nr:hypothetical protein [Herbinix sp.]